jgi:acetyl esterase/lipase
MLKIFLIVILTLASLPHVFAGIIKDSTFFDTVGSVKSFSWAPSRYQNDFRYDIFYYIPESLKDEKNVPALIFNHGGGSSTMNREGSIKAVNLYINNLKRLADELKIIVVLPSANGLNWGGHTRGLVRDLARLIRKDLDVDANRIGLSGHSMGGMGITRSYLWLADELSFFLPMSAGMDVNHQSEEHLNKVFNVPYVHLQGLRDHFEVFITRCEEQLRRTKELETSYNQFSMFDMVFYEGSHNYDYELFKSKVNRLMGSFPRDLFQKELWGSLHTVQSTNTENGIAYDYDSENRYFWIEVRETDLTISERIDFHAKIDQQNVLIDLKIVPKHSKVLRVYLSSKMIDLSLPVEVYVNGLMKERRMPRELGQKITDSHDPGFIFDDFIDIAL